MKHRCLYIPKHKSYFPFILAVQYRITFSFFTQLAQTVSIKPFGGVCNSTEQLKLICVNKADHLQAGWSVAWVHTLNGVFMRSPFTTRQGNLSILEIHFCDYTDTGSYSCKWSKGKIVYAYTVELIVHGKNIVFGFFLTCHDQNILMRVFLFIYKIFFFFFQF